MGGISFGDWPTAMQSAALLEDGLCGLSAGSEPGDWRLPTEHEWYSTLSYPLALGCTGASSPTWLNDAGTACISTPATSFLGVSAVSYRSSTIDGVATGFAEVGNLSTGATSGQVAKFGNADFWAVRG